MEILYELGMSFGDFFFFFDQDSQTLDKHALVFECSVEGLDCIPFVCWPIFEEAVEKFYAVDFFLVGLTILQSGDVLTDEKLFEKGREFRRVFLKERLTVDHHDLHNLQEALLVDWN